ncbi:MAG: tetratricopeptide repeat protein [Bacteroidia bacterium]|nr:tetratricopeptide repeat protein [Bacteroidia bacterium]NNF30614.1 tetratricopeptide repeat protein [Flavobacteriaceae bacterium]MBT8276281.1 tetratricopeptide repeat protein [Bacteroidia bacterium]NNJ80915.1 tetratricopeptide repeat protein [Flavobacteriaceae bacterium]NNK53174.1 tetratricopeptide repeat protein [Flavobacteriaceae bacterium]
MKKLLFFLLFPGLLWAQTTFQEAEAFFDNEQFNKAKPLFQKFLKENPNHTKTREYLGDIAGYAKNWDEAISYYEPLVEEDPRNANYHFKCGGAMGMKALEISRIRALGYIGDIKRHFETAAKLDPKHIEVRWALVEYYIQLPGIIGGSERKAIKNANELLKISPVDGYLANGYIAEYTDRPEDAERFYKKAIKVGGSPHTYEKLTNLYEKNEQPREAMQTAANSLKKHKRNSLNYQIGKIAAQYNLNAELGIDCLQAYIKNYSVRDGVPKDWAYYRLAQIYKNIGRKDKALQWIDKALTDRPDFPEAIQERHHILSL